MMREFGITAMEAGGRAHYSCDGRLGGKGCDWSLGGLLMIHTLEVISSTTGRYNPSFELASKKEADGFKAKEKTNA